MFDAGCKVWDVAPKLAESRWSWEREKERKSEKLIKSRSFGGTED